MACDAATPTAEPRSMEPTPSARPASILRVAVPIAISTIVAVIAHLVVRERALADPERAIRNGELLLSVERAVRLDVERGVQAVVLTNDTVITLANAIYTFGYWPVLLSAAAILARKDRAGLAVMGSALAVSGLVGMAIFAVFPVAPPRMLPGFVDTMGARWGSTAIARPGGLANPYAAMPSFHVGWIVLAGLAVGRGRRRTVRWSLLVPGVVMALVVVITANHYLVDIAGGIGVALGSLRLVDAVRPAVQARIVAARVGSANTVRPVDRLPSERPNRSTGAARRSTI